MIKKNGINIDDDADHDVAMVYLAYKTLTEIQTTLAGKVQILCYTFKHNANKNNFVWSITFGDFMLGPLNSSISFHSRILFFEKFNNVLVRKSLNFIFYIYIREKMWYHFHFHNLFCTVLLCLVLGWPYSSWWRNSGTLFWSFNSFNCWAHYFLLRKMFRTF